MNDSHTIFCRTADDERQAPLIHQEAPSQPEVEEKGPGEARTEDGPPPIPEQDVLAGAAAPGGAGGPPAHQRPAPDGKDVPLIDQ